MGWVARGVFLAAAAGGAVVTNRVVAARRPGGPRADDGHGDSALPRWHTVTVYRPLDEVAPQGRVPAPLSELDDVEVRFLPAPGDRGTEIAVRLRDGEPSGAAAVATRITGKDPRHAVRRALRETKSLLETGQVLLPDSPPTTRRTLLSRPLQYATAHGREEGLL